jgi:hypothetical protein
MQDDAYQEDEETTESGIGSTSSRGDEGIGREEDMDMSDTDTGFSE